MSEVIVAGHLIVDAAERDAYLKGCVPVVEQARLAPGCRDYALSPDLVDPARINIWERWASQADVDTFRGDGVSEEQRATIRSASVSEYDVASERQLT